MVARTTAAMTAPPPMQRIAVLAVIAVWPIGAVLTLAGLRRLLVLRLAAGDE